MPSRATRPPRRDPAARRRPPWRPFAAAFDALERREVPASLFVGITAPVGGVQDLVGFNGDNPASFRDVGPLTGVTPGYTIQALARDPLSNVHYGFAVNADGDGQVYRVDVATAAATALGTPYHAGGFAAAPDGFYAKGGRQYAYSGNSVVIFDRGGVAATNVTVGSLPAAQAAVVDDQSSNPAAYGLTNAHQTYTSTAISFVAGPSPSVQFAGTTGLQVTGVSINTDTSFVAGLVFDAATNANDYNLYSLRSSNGQATRLATLPRALHGLADLVLPPYLAVTGVPTTTAAGTVETLTVTAYNGDGSVDTGYNGTVFLASSDPNAILPAAATLANGTGRFAVAFATAGTQAITATDPAIAGLAASTGGITVAPGALDRYVVAASPPAGGNVAGVALTFTATAYDRFGNVVTTASNPDGVEDSDPAAGPAATTAAGVTTIRLTPRLAGPHVLTVASSSSPVAATFAYDVAPGAATRLAIAGIPAAVTAGAAHLVTITALDAFGNVATGDAATIAYSSTDPAGPAGTVALVDGVATVAATFATAGTQAFLADEGGGVVGRVIGIDVAPAAAARLEAGFGPARTTDAGEPTTLFVAAYDPFGNVATTFADPIRLISGDARAVLPPDARLVAGRGQFAVVFARAGAATVTATSLGEGPELTATGSIWVGSSGVASFRIDGPTAAVAGRPFNLRVTAVDRFGNAVSDWPGSVGVTTTDAAATVPASSPNVILLGLASNAITLRAAGATTITVASGAEPSLRGSITLQVAAGSLASLTLAPVGGAAGVAGAVVTYRVRGLDAFGNLATGSDATIALASSDPTAALPASVTLAGGVAEFAVAATKAGPLTITATADPGAGAPAVATAGAAIAAGPAVRFVVDATAIGDAGRPIALAVTAVDAFGNVATGYAGTVRFASSDPAAALPAPAALVAGTGTFAATLNTPGAATIVVADATDPTIAGTAATTVAASPPPPPTVVTGTVFLDRNADGVQDAGEPGLPGRTVYLDANGDGVLDAGEPSAITDDSGSFRLTVAPGVAGTVREAAGLAPSFRSAFEQVRTGGDGAINLGVVPVSPLVPLAVALDPAGAGTAADPGSAYARALYRAVLGRDGADAEVAGWAAALAGGASRAEVAARFVNSPEHRAAQVAAYYETFLHRAADPSSAGWVAALMNGASEQEVVAGFLDSAEYRALHAGNAALVAALYDDVLGRDAAADAAGATYWQGQLDSGMAPDAVVAGFVAAPEAIDAVVDGFYSAYLRRAKDAGATTWGDDLAQGQSAGTVAAAILASDEFAAAAIGARS